MVEGSTCGLAGRRFFLIIFFVFFSLASFAGVGSLLRSVLFVIVRSVDVTWMGLLGPVGEGVD